MEERISDQQGKEGVGARLALRAKRSACHKENSASAQELHQTLTISMKQALIYPRLIRQ